MPPVTNVLFLALSVVLLLTQILTFVPYWAEHDNNTHIGPFYVEDGGNITWVLDWYETQGKAGEEWIAIAVMSVLTLATSIASLIIYSCCRSRPWLLSLGVLQLLGFVVITICLTGVAGPKIDLSAVSIVYLILSGICTVSILVCMFFLEIPSRGPESGPGIYAKVRLSDYVFI
jgi:hypothetical protein